MSARTSDAAVVDGALAELHRDLTRRHRRRSTASAACAVLAGITSLFAFTGPHAMIPMVALAALILLAVAAFPGRSGSIRRATAEVSARGDALAVASVLSGRVADHLDRTASVDRRAAGSYRRRLQTARPGGR